MVAELLKIFKQQEDNKVFLKYRRYLDRFLRKEELKSTLSIDYLFPTKESRKTIFKALDLEKAPHDITISLQGSAGKKILINAKNLNYLDYSEIDNFSALALCCISSEYDKGIILNALHNLGDVYDDIILYVGNLDYSKIEAKLESHDLPGTIHLIVENEEGMEKQLVEFLSDNEKWEEYVKVSELRFIKNLKEIIDYILFDLNEYLDKTQLKYQILSNKQERLPFVPIGGINRELGGILKDEVEAMYQTVSYLSDEMTYQFDSNYGNVTKEAENLIEKINVKDDLIFNEVDEKSSEITFNGDVENRINNIIQEAVSKYRNLLESYGIQEIDNLNSEIKSHLEEKEINSTFNLELIKEKYIERNNALAIKEINVDYSTKFVTGNSKMDYFMAFRKWLFLPISLGMFTSYISGIWTPAQKIEVDNLRQERSMVMEIYQEEFFACKKSKTNVANRTRECEKYIIELYDTEFEKNLFHQIYEDKSNMSWFSKYLDNAGRNTFLGIVLVILIPWLYKQGKDEVLEKAKKTRTDNEDKALTNVKRQLDRDVKSALQQFIQENRMNLNHLKQNLSDEMKIFQVIIASDAERKNANRKFKQLEIRDLLESFKQDIKILSKLKMDIERSRTNIRNRQKSLVKDIKSSLTKNSPSLAPTITTNIENAQKRREEVLKRLEAFKKNRVTTNNS